MNTGIHKMLKRLITLLMLLTLSSTAFATLELELTQGVDGAWPIAIVPFADQPENLAKVTAVMQADLQNSGRFRVLTKFKQQPHEAKAVDFDYWRSQGVDNLVVGKIEPAENNQLRVIFELLDLHGNKALIASKQFLTSPDEIRSLAHHLSDIVYKEITGDQGVFSTRIAYVLVQRQADASPQFTLEIADADGYNAKPLLSSKEPLMSPSWSPDGKQLAFVSFEHRKAEIYTINVVNGKRDLVSSFPRINGAPSWSPDGKKLALVLSKSGTPKIYTLDLASKKLTQLTRGWSIDTEPSWAPDGKSLIFTSGRGGPPQIYSYDFASKSSKRISFDGSYNARASFSRDGKSLVLLHREQGMYNIAIQDLSTGRVRNLTKLGMDESPSLSPNGKMVLYATRHGGSGVLGLVSTDGRVRLRLPARQGDVQEPAWSPV